MSEPSAFTPEHVEEIEAAVGVALAEVWRLRFGGPAPSPEDEPIAALVLPRIEDGPEAALEHLAGARQRLDRIEELLGTVTAFRTQLHRRHAEAEAAVSDAWSAAVTDTGGGHRRSASFGDSAPRERYAAADVATLEQRRVERLAQRALSHVSAATETIRTAHFGVDKYRQDVHVVIRAMVVESALER